MTQSSRALATPAFYDYCMPLHTLNLGFDVLMNSLRTGIRSTAIYLSLSTFPTYCFFGMFLHLHVFLAFHHFLSFVFIEKLMF